MRELFAFFGRELVGTFREADGLVSFDYVDDYEGTPLSLSLPLGATSTAGAAYAYLDNLLPDQHQVRARWARERGLPAADPFTLLAEYGEDVAGALSLSPDPNLDSRRPGPATVIQATDDDIAARIASLAIDDTSWTDPRVRPRMSLAGAQGSSRWPGSVTGGSGPRTRSRRRTS